MSQTHEDTASDAGEGPGDAPDRAHDDVVATGDASDEVQPTGVSVDVEPDADVPDTDVPDPAVAETESAPADADVPDTEVPAPADADVPDTEVPAPADAETESAPAVPDVPDTERASADAETESTPSVLSATDDAGPDTDEGDPDTSASPAGSAARSRRFPSRDLLEKEGEIAADFLETLLDICDLDGDLDVDIDGDRAAVSIVDSDEGRVPRRLVGSDGKVLDALQELTRLAVYSSTGERSRLILDIAGHRAGRRSILVDQAQTAIAAVKESGEQQALAPMSAFERKIVHDEVLAAGLRSESDGVEPRRFVVVLPA